MDKSYVTIEVCLLCGEETGSLLMDRRLKNSFEKHTRTLTVCEKCEEKYLTKGVLLIEANKQGKKTVPIGNILVLKDEAFKSVFNAKVPPKKRAFVEEGIIQQIQQMVKGDSDGQ